MSGSWRILILLILSVCMLSGCQPGTSTDEQSRQVFMTQRALALEAFQPCPRTATTVMASLVAESLCGRLTVPENYDDPEGRQIELKVMVIPALSDLPEPDPLMLLAGGPGQAATDLVQVVPVFARSRTDRDIVLVDQRGTGELSPFDCQMDEEDAMALEEKDPGFDELLEIQLQVLRDCLATMDASPQYYSTDIAMRDLDAVRTWLGYTSLNLWGASYGSRAALAYLQAYPESTRTVIIDAIAPPTLALPLYTARDASASLKKLLDDCVAEKSCNSAFPDLAAHYQELLARLETPQPVTITVDRDFSTIDATLSDYEFMNVIRQVLYSREAQRLIPFIIEQAWQGNYRPVFALASGYSEAEINQGMFLSVICNEDVTRIDPGQREEQSGNDYLLESTLFDTFVFAACELWPKRKIPAAYFEPVSEDRPVLIFSGTLDPITPPRWGELVQSSLPDSKHLVLEGFGHGTLFTSCTAGIMNEFIDSGHLDGLDTDCIGKFKRRPFFVTPGGSTLIND